ncbi:ComF family protein [Chloroflexota bacterium]
MLSQVIKFKGMALDLLFPRWCVGCGEEGNFICVSCRRGLLPIKPPICPRCGHPQADEALCSSCASGQTAIDDIRSPFIFSGVMRQAIHQFKYRNLKALATTLAELLLTYLEANPLPAEVLVPVPLHQTRLRERGYNQSELLAKELGKMTELPVLNECLIRERYSLPQARTATAAERKKNVENAFSCPGTSLESKRLLLIDDVTTSGATLNAAATVLKEAGAISVWGLVVAREV